MKRRDFLRHVTVAGIAAPALVAATCGGDDDDGSQTPGGGNPTGGAGSCSTNGTSVQIQDPHGHQMTVSADDVKAGVEKTYQIKGGSAHDHSVTVTAAMFAALQMNQTRSATSSSGSGHTHQITISCR